VPKVNESLRSIFLYEIGRAKFDRALWRIKLKTILPSCRDGREHGGHLKLKIKNSKLYSTLNPN